MGVTSYYLTGVELMIIGYEIQGRENETLSKQFELTILKILRAHVVWSDSGRPSVMIINGNGSEPHVVNVMQYQRLPALNLTQGVSSDILQRLEKT